jgi:hypothetical protein
LEAERQATARDISSSSNGREFIFSVAKALEFIDLKFLLILSDVRQKMVVDHTDLIGHRVIIGLDYLRSGLVVLPPLHSLLMANSSKIDVNSKDGAELSNALR